MRGMPQPDDEPVRDLVVIGGSSGGFEALTALLRSLPSPFPAAICVVLHVPSTPSQVLPTLLSRCSELTARHPTDGERLGAGQIYVAPPDHHLLIERDSMYLGRGPRENEHRPAVDPLFRSAARWYGPRAIGVVLSGARDDGTAGLQAIKLAGGMAVVQDLAEASHASMPRHAIEHVEVDHIVPIGNMGELLHELVLRDLPRATTLQTETVSRKKRSAQVEEAVWLALRTLRGSAQQSLKLAAQARGRHLDAIARMYEERAIEADESAVQLEHLLVQEFSGIKTDSAAGEILSDQEPSASRNANSKN